jgi:chemotaxis protein MotA
MEKSTVIGLLVGIGGILLGNIIEGGHVASLVQGAAFVIVFSGTFGAVLVSSSMDDFKKGLSLFKKSFFKHDDKADFKIKSVVEMSKIARKDTVLSLESKMNEVSDPFMAGILRAVIDGVDSKTIRNIFETAILAEEEVEMAGAKIWLDAGGYAPTIGIIGAVLGLIHVMGNLSDTSKLGAGIAVAFVATVYGVASANLIFLPIGNKIKKRIQHESQVKMMILEGILEIPSGLNPVIINQKMRSFIEKSGELDA